jgi:hypothetical protein
MQRTVLKVYDNNYEDSVMIARVVCRKCCSVDNVFSARRVGPTNLTVILLFYVGAKLGRTHKGKSNVGIRDRVTEEGIRLEKEVKGTLVKLHLMIFLIYTCHQISLAC